jgi:hypothetical protein
MGQFVTTFHRASRPSFRRCYVAATLTSILQLLFFVIRARGFRRRQDDTYV